MNTFVILGLVVLFAVTSAKRCNSYPGQCHMDCRAGEVNACERGVCTCSPQCLQKSDCLEHCDTTATFAVSNGNRKVEHSAHCVDRACLCIMHAGQFFGK